MADSGYISKNLTTEQIRFVKLMDEHELHYFNMQDVEETLNASFGNLNEVLENLVHKQFLRRLERGKYCRHDFNDVHVLASFISRNGTVAYWSALHLHGLSDRFPNKIFIKTSFRKRETNLFGTAVKFVSVQPRKAKNGKITQGYGDRAYPLTDVEMTLLDCFDQPVYAGDWPDLLRAFCSATVKNDKLIRYAKTYNNNAVIKRMGYLAELCQKDELVKFISFAQNNIGQKYSLFDASGPDKGSFNKRWKLRMNMSEEDVLSIVSNPY